MNFSPNLSPMVASNLAPATRDAVASLYCVFRAGEDFFALPLLQVEEIVSAPMIAELPASPPFWRFRRCCPIRNTASWSALAQDAAR